MIRWRCQRSACFRKGSKGGKTSVRAASKKKFPVPRCPRCCEPMRIDHYRTSRIEKRRGNCYCGVPRFKAGAPHQRNYCRQLERAQFEESRKEVCYDSA